MLASSPEGLRYEAPDLLSAYLWSHYADLFEDPEATGAYSEWAGQISPVAGAALDAGCAAGRFCFEMSLKCDLVIGVDLSESFISMARRIMEQRKLDFPAQGRRPHSLGKGLRFTCSMGLAGRWNS